MPVTRGITQGGVLSPLLFVLFINDMPYQVRLILKLFADDSKLIGVIKNPDDADVLQVDLDNLTKWSED